MTPRLWLIVSRGICGGTAFGQLVTLPARSEETVGLGVALMLSTGLGWLLFDRELRRMARRDNER